MKGLSLTLLSSHLSLLGFPLIFGFFSILLFLRPHMELVATFLSLAAEVAVVEVFLALPFSLKTAVEVSLVPSIMTTKVFLAPLFSLLAEAAVVEVFFALPFITTKVFLAPLFGIGHHGLR